MLAMLSFFLMLRLHPILIFFISVSGFSCFRTNLEKMGLLAKVTPLQAKKMGASLQSKQGNTHIFAEIHCAVVNRHGLFALP